MKILFDILTQIVSGLTFALLLVSCNSHPAAKAGKDSLANDPADKGQQNIVYNPGTLTIAPALLKKYQEACLRDTASYDKKFVSNFFNLVKKFNGKKLARNEMDSSALSIVYDQGIDDLNRAGIHVDKEQYKAYLRDFKGDLLAYGQPESREGLWIWYKPAGRMITYYHP